MDVKSTSSAGFLDKMRDVTETLRAELNVMQTQSEHDPENDTEFETKNLVNTGPAPTMKRRRLIFDSLRTIIERDAGKNASGKGDEDRGRYVYVFGAGYHGQLGRKAARGHKKYANIPIPIHLKCAIREISCGALHSAVVTDDGKVFTWGDGRMGQLGHLQEGFSNQPVPTQVSSLSAVSIAHISCGQNHTICITDEGQMYSWGWAKHGQLGLGTRTNQRYPCLLGESSNMNDEADGEQSTEEHSYDSIANKRIAQVSCGDRHSVCITRDGEIYSFGSGEHGQLGHDNNHDQYYPKKITYFSSYSRHGNMKIKHSSCGSIHTACVTTTGHLYIFGFGENLYGKQVSNNDDNDNIGKNDPNSNFHYQPIHIPFPKCTISSVACGQSHILILTEGGDIYAWGDGSYGEIGHGAYKASPKPRLVLLNKSIASIACGRYHSSAVSNCGTLYTWGCGDNGQLGRLHGSQSGDSQQASNYACSKMANSVPKLVCSLLGNVVAEISCGEHHTCVLASCRYSNLAEDVWQYCKLEEMEFQAKINLLSSSKQKGRGVAKKDLLRIKKWRKDQELKKKKKQEYDLMQEQKKIEQEINKIQHSHQLRSDIIRLSSTTNNRTNKTEEISEAAQSVSPSKVQKTKNIDLNDISNNIADIIEAAPSTNFANLAANLNSNSTRNRSQASLKKVQSASNNSLGKIDGGRISAKKANNHRCSFHEQKRNFLSEVATQILGSNQSTKQSFKHQARKKDLLMKKKFTHRKELDKLKLVAIKREQTLLKMDEELSMLQSVDDCSELASKNAEQELRKLGMKLNTVQIKISEAERSRKTYELNIIHIKDESQEMHKQLDQLRRNLFLQQNLKKKILKFRDYATQQRDFAVLGIKEFMTELKDWRHFLDFQYKNLANVAQVGSENNLQNTNKASEMGAKPRDEKQYRKQQKALQRIQKLNKLLDANNKELTGLKSQLGGFENQIDYFDERFERIYNVTGLTNAQKIIDKFFVNLEMHSEQTKVVQELYSRLKSKEEDAHQLDKDLKKQHANKLSEQSWREIDELHEELQKCKHKLMTTKLDEQRSELQFTLLIEWIMVIIGNLSKYIQQYDLPTNAQDIEMDDAPIELIQTLSSSVNNLLNITTDIKTETFKIKKVETAADSDEDVLSFETHLKTVASHSQNQNKKNVNRGRHKDGKKINSKRKIHSKR